MRIYTYIVNGDVAQLEEHLICIQKVVGSIPSISTNFRKIKMKVEIDKETNEVVIRLPIEKQPKDSASGKTKIIASSSGRNVTTESYDGKQLMVTASVYYKP